MLLDPSFLLYQLDYESLLEKEERCLPNADLSAYILDMNPDKGNIISWIYEYLGCNSILRLSIQDYEEEGKRSGTFKYPSISRWLAIYAKGSFIITDSYHGCVFSILFNKPFVVVANQQRGLARFTSLLSMFGLQSRIVYSLDDLQSRCEEVTGQINYDTINGLLAKKREDSLKFLIKNLCYGK